MTITELLAKAELPATVQGEDKHLSGLAYDSREAKAGDLFFCLVGLKQDGHSFAPDAYQKGVRAFVVERLLDLPQDAAQILVPDSRAAMEIFSAAFWDFPARKLKTVGVTGTNGKTTTTYMIRSILSAAGFKVGLLGTIGNLIEDEFIPAERTTPEAPDSQALFAQMVEKGLTHLVMEVSSHAIHQKRISGRDFTVGVFTNLSQDHLDYHETMEEYSQVKADFFRQLPKEAAAVINLDDPYHKLMAEAASCRVIGYSLERGQLKGKILSLAPEGMTLQMETPAWREEVRLSLTGSFNAANALAAAGAALALGIDKEAIVRGLESTGRAGPFSEDRLRQANCDRRLRPHPRRPCQRPLHSQENASLQDHRCLRLRRRQGQREAAANGQNRRGACRLQHNHLRQSQKRRPAADLRRGGSRYQTYRQRIHCGTGSENCNLQGNRHGRGRRSGFNCRQRPRNISDLSRQDHSL